ncbi:MFS transporter [Haladaptatus sp. DYF46]|uniref:MFS transporter n=1 Tax=Haladaptatus sp. DYF46 TaxID=2886041 RepID=UPI001E51D08E|nr:MFS transporter [Haladaptatus sp. DYF46]
MVFLVNFARVVFAPLLEPLKHEFLVSDATIGLVASLVWLGSALPRIPTGYLLTRIERHYVVLGAGVVLTVSSGLTAFAPSVPLLAVGAFSMGVSSAVYFIAANPLVSELYPERVGRALGIHGTASQLAAAIAPVFVGVTLTVVGWRGVFELLAAVAAVVTAVFFAVARRTDLPEAGVADRDFLTAFRRQWPIILSGVAIIGATGLVWNGLFNWYPSYISQTKGLSLETGRTLLTVLFAAGVPAFWLTGRLADRLPHVPLMLSILGSFIVCLVSLTLAQGLAAIVGISLVLGYVIHSLFPALDTYLLDSLPDENRASAYAMYSGLAMIGQAGGSSLVGTLLDAQFAFDTIFRTLAVGLFAILAVLLALHRTDRLPTGAVTS